MGHSQEAFSFRLTPRVTRPGLSLGLVTFNDVGCSAIHRAIPLGVYGTHTDNTNGATMTTDGLNVLALHDPDAQRKIANRLRRAHGQLAAVINAVKRDAHCRDFVRQLPVVSKALDRAGYLVISTVLPECLADPASTGTDRAQELKKLSLSLA